MIQPVPQDVLRKIRKLAQLAADLPQSRWAMEVTRLTSLKSLCQDPAGASRFVTFLARKTLEHVERGQKNRTEPGSPKDAH